MPEVGVDVGVALRCLSVSMLAEKRTASNLRAKVCRIRQLTSEVLVSLGGLRNRESTSGGPTAARATHSLDSNWEWK